MALIAANNKPNKPEPKKSRSGLKVNYLIILLNGLVLVIAAILTFLLIVKNVYGNYELSEILPTFKNINKVTQKEKVAILYSKYTETMLKEGDTWLQDVVNTWESYLKIFRLDYQVISDLDIELGKHFEYDVLLLPGSFSLSDRETVQIKKFLDEGGSVFATGGTGTYSNNALWRGWDFFTEVYGLKFNRELRLEEGSKIHTLRGNLPITAEIPTGYTLKIATWDRPIYAEVVEPRTIQISFWYDYRKEGGLVREEIKKGAGSAFGDYGKGRFVWFGFDLNSVIGKQNDFIYLEKLLRNSFNWLTYKPTAFVKDWPEPFVSAALIVPTVNSTRGISASIDSVFNSFGYSPTVFADGILAYENPSVIRNLSKARELGVIADIGFIESINDTGQSLYDKQTQTEILKYTKDTVQSLTGKPVKGFMPYYGYYDENTLQVLANEGYEFLITDSLTDRSVPLVEYRNDKRILILTKTARDDYKIIRDYGLTNLDFQEYTYEEDIDRLIFEGGLYVLKVHNDGQLLPQYSSVLGRLMDYMKQNNVWLTTIPELMQWWKDKGGIEVRYETRSQRRVTVEISNPKETGISNFVVQLNMNKRITNIEISSEIINTKLPKYKFDDSDNTLYLFLDHLESGETRIYLIDFTNAEA